MCYLGDPFVHDIFVSYSHGDPEGRGTSPLKEWSRALIRHLEEEIRAPWPEFDRLRIFIDEKLDPTLALTAELRAQVQVAGLLIVIMTERWLNSAWCRDEIDWFRQQVAQRGGINGSVVVIRAFATETSAWPECLKDERGHGLIGISFHPLTGNLNAPPYGWREEKPSQREYWQAVAQLATTVIKRLRDLKNREELRRAQRRVIGLGANSKPRLYLHGRTKRADVWCGIRERLEEAGFTVEPAKLPEIGTSLLEIRRAQRERLEQLSRCHALLILRSDRMDDITLDLEACQADRADMAARGQHLPIAVLDSTMNEAGASEALGVEVLAGRGRGWLVGVREWLHRSASECTEEAA